MPLLLLLPLGFAILGGVVAYVVGREVLHLQGRALWGQVAGGALGGLLGGALTVFTLGTGTAVAAAASSFVPEATAQTIGTVTEWSALAFGQAAGGAAGQVATNAVEGEPLGEDTLAAGAIAFGSQLVLGPIGNGSAAALAPIAKQVGGVAIKRLAGETTTEALCDAGTMVVPMPDARKDPSKTPGITGALEGAPTTTGR